MTTDGTAKTVLNGWYEDPDEQKAFLDLLNFEGFLLEDSVREIIYQSSLGAELHSNEVFERPLHHGGGRAEIDLWVKIGNFVFLIESKRSDFDWVFLQNENSTKDIHLITGPNKEIFIHNRILKGLNCVSRQVIEVLEDESAPKLCKHTKGKSQASLPVKSSRDDYVRTAMRQALFNTEILLHSHLEDPRWTGQAHRIFVPLIVTNSQLISGTYRSSDINTEAKLTKIDFSLIQEAALNHAEILRWGPNYEKELEHKGRPATGPLHIADERYIGTHYKTVFVVSKNHLINFIHKIIQSS